MKRTLPETLQRIWADTERIDETLRAVINSIDSYVESKPPQDDFLVMIKKLLVHSRDYQTKQILDLMKNE